MHKVVTVRIASGFGNIFISITEMNGKVASLNFPNRMPRTIDSSALCITSSFSPRRWITVRYATLAR